MRAHRELAELADVHPTGKQQLETQQGALSKSQSFRVL